MGFTSLMAHSCFLFSVPEHTTVLPLSFSLLWTRYFGLFGKNLSQPRHKPNSFVPCPAAVGQLSCSHTQSWLPELQPGHSSKDLGCTVWEDKHPSNESHSHLQAPTTRLSYIACISITLLYFYVFLNNLCFSEADSLFCLSGSLQNFMWGRTPNRLW